LFAFNRYTGVLIDGQGLTSKPHYLLSHPKNGPTEVNWPLDNPPADPKRCKASTMKIGTNLGITSWLLLAVRKPSPNIPKEFVS